VVRPCEWFAPLRKGRLRGVFLTFAMVGSVESVKLVKLVELVELGKTVGDIIWRLKNRTRMTRMERIFTDKNEFVIYLLFEIWILKFICILDRNVFFHNQE